VYTLINNIFFADDKQNKKKDKKNVKSTPNGVQNDKSKNKTKPKKKPAGFISTGIFHSISINLINFIYLLLSNLFF
jgi:hypothetical protein